jgi:hypothetical protein
MENWARRVVCECCEHVSLHIYDGFGAIHKNIIRDLFEQA